MTWRVHLSLSYLFAFSYCSGGSQGKNTEVVSHSVLQWATFCQNSPLWPVHLGSDLTWPGWTRYELVVVNPTWIAWRLCNGTGAVFPRENLRMTRKRKEREWIWRVSQKIFTIVYSERSSYSLQAYDKRNGMTKEWHSSYTSGILSHRTQGYKDTIPQFLVGEDWE